MFSLLVRTVFCAFLCGPVMGQEYRGPDLAVASNFGQGFLADLAETALVNGITDFRDALYWDRVEQPDGTFIFNTDETSYPDILAAANAQMSLTVNNGHPLYDDGNTPTSPEAVAAFGRHAAETVARFPAITAIEVGNEFNGPNFVSGPLKGAGLEARADAYVALLKEVATQARAVRPDIRIIGGAVHSIPTGYLQMLLDRGAAEYMDTLALHPYSTPVEHYAKQIEVLRDIPSFAEIPIEITEFGTQDAVLAPGKLIRAHCQYALASASRLAWYAVNERGDNYAPLITRDGQTTPVFAAFEFAQKHLVGKSVTNAAPDPSTYACLYDDQILVIWGMPRAVTVNAGGIAALDPTGATLSGKTFVLSETEPLILMSDEPMDLTDSIQLAQQTVLADSYHGFTYPPDEDRQGRGFQRLVRSNGQDVPMTTMPGQAREGRPWTPWLGIPENGDVRVLPRTLLPGGTRNTPVEIVHRYIATKAETVDLRSTFTPADRSTDGVDVTVQIDRVTIWETQSAMAAAIDLPDLDLPVGSILDVIVGPGETARGDVTDYRITLTEASR